MREELERQLLKEKVDIDKIIEIVPELRLLKNCTQNHPAHCYKVCEHTQKVIEYSPMEIGKRINALGHDSGKPICKVLGDDGVEHFKGHEEESAKITEKMLRRIGYEEDFIKKRIAVIKIHDMKIKPNIHEIKSIIDRVGRDVFEELLILQEADLLAHHENRIKAKMPTLNKIKELYRDIM